MAWTLEQYAKKNSSKDLEGTQLDLLQCIVWAIATWNEMEQEIIHNAWRVPNILPQHWNANIQNLHDRVKSRIDEEVSKPQKLIASLIMDTLKMVDPLRNFTLKIILTWLMKTSQNMSIQQLRLFIWYIVTDRVAVEGLVASNDEHFD